MKTRRNEWMAWVAAVLALLAAVLGPGLARAQGAYLIGPDDSLKISVYQNADLSFETRVSAAGVINFPLLGKVTASGKTAAELADHLQQQLIAGGYLKQAFVNVLVTDFRSRTVAVLGHVARPGRYPIDVGERRLSEILALAGGVLPSGGSSVVIQRDGRTLAPVSLAGMFSAGAGAQADPLIEGGDRIFIDRAERFFVRGEVNRPSDYVWTEGLTVGQALAMGGGLTPRGTDRSIQVFRLANGQRQRLEVRPDTQVRPGDEIVVGERLL
jgi:polysaccharide biosynthesis/export protein